MGLEIKEVGVKLKELRKTLGIKQDDLVRYSSNGKEDKPFTRNLISMIETGNAAVTPALRLCIEYNINHIIEEKNINIKIDFNEVFMSPEEQGEYLVDEFLNNLSNKISEEEIFSYGDKLLTVLEEKKFYGQMGRVLIFLGIKSYKKDQNYDKALEYLNKAQVFNGELSDRDKAELAVKLKFCYIKKSEFEKALNITYDNNSKNISAIDKCKFNDIITLSKLERSNEISFEMLKEMYSRYPKNHQFYYGLKIIQGNKYFIIGKFHKALSIYKKLKSIYRDILTKNNMNYNIFCVALRTGDSAKEELDELLDFLFSKEKALSRHEREKYYSGIEHGIRTQNVYPIKTFFEGCISKALEDNDEEYFNRYIMKLMYEIDIEKFQEMESFQLYILSGVEKNIFDSKVLMKVILYFQEREKYEIVKTILERASM